MKIIIKELSLKNFKGIKKHTVEFDESLTDVLARNEGGKTTLYDAWLWLTTGKDSSGRTTFGIKPIDADGKVIHKLETEVFARCDIDGDEVTIKKTLREIWRGERGGDPIFKGNENIYEWNNVPLKEEDYQGKWSSIINADILRIVTNPAHFNNDKLTKWESRRATLVQIAGAINVADILKKITTDDNRDAVKKFNTILTSKKTIKEYSAEIAASVKKIDSELKLIPARINENTLKLPQEEPDFEEIRSQMDAKLQEISTIDALIVNSSNALKSQQDKAKNIQKQINENEIKLRNMENNLQGNITNERYERENKISNLNFQIEQLQKTILQRTRDKDDAQKQLVDLESEREKLINDWHKENNRVLEFSDDAFICPTCGQALAESDIESTKERLTKNFNENKVKTLADITSKGKRVKENIVYYTKQVEQMEEDIKDKQAQIVIHNSELTSLTSTPATDRDVKKELHSNVSYNATELIVANLRKELDKIDTIDNSELQNRKSDLQQEYNQLQLKYSEKNEIEKLKARIKELEENEREYAQQLADIKKMQNVIAKFEFAKMEYLEERVNQMFRHVRFRLFETLVNGEINLTCTATYKGVPFDDLNTAGKVFAGLDIIYTLNKFYDIYCPIFVDQRESVFEIPEMNTQIINLIHDPTKNKLTIIRGMRQRSKSSGVTTENDLFS